jgi:hypothetical protein
VAWKVHAILQMPGRVDPTVFPCGGYRVRCLHNENMAALGDYLESCVAADRFVVPYIEIPYSDAQNIYMATTPEATWTANLATFCGEIVNARTAAPHLIPYVELGNEIKRHDPPPATRATHQVCWDTYVRVMEISSQIIRDAGLGVMLSSLGFTRYQREFFQYLSGPPHFAMRLVDSVAVHIYSGGSHADGSPANARPADSLRKLADCRAALDEIGLDWMELHATELGWPTIAPQAPDPGHQSYCTPAEQANRIGDVFTLLYRDALLHRLRSASLFTARDYRSDEDNWNAATNTPTLVNGTSSGEGFYRVTVAGTQNFGAGNITFAVGDPVSYNGAQWVKAEVDTPGNWPHHAGAAWEPGTPRCLAEDPTGSCHKPSWDVLDSPTVGIGRGTAAVRPTVTTGTVSEITGATAKIAAQIHPQGQITKWRVEYGRDANFGTRSPIRTIPAGSSIVNVEEILTGLTANVGWHYRVIAWSDGGANWGSRLQFTSTPPPPPPPPPPVPGVAGPLWPSEALWPSENLWPGTGELLTVPPQTNPPWSGPRRFNPKAGSIGKEGSIAYHPRSYTLNLGDVIDAGGWTTSDPDLKHALRTSGLFDEVPA